MDINQIKDQYTCIICQDIFTDPVKLLKCGHTFCKNCINDYTKSQKNQKSINCPNCRMPYNQTDIFNDF